MSVELNLFVIRIYLKASPWYVAVGACFIAPFQAVDGLENNSHPITQ